jgi:hypothetical protein
MHCAKQCDATTAFGDTRPWTNAAVNVCFSDDPDIADNRSEGVFLTHTCRDTAAPSQLLEIRLIRSRDLNVLFSAVLAGIFGADIFQPFAQRAPIGYGRRPGHREHAFILDRHLQL